jgi:hypothetical protein
MAIRLRQPAFTAATTILVAILLLDSYILINHCIPMSLSHDVGDLANARMAAVGDNNLYVTWDNYLAGKHDILLAKSTDCGNSFGKVVDISKNLGASGRPSISAYNGNVYVVWNDNSTGNYEIYFTKSTDGGYTFSDLVNLSKNTE